MSTQKVLLSTSFPASADLSAQQYRAVILDGSQQLAVAGAGGAAIGILQDKPSAAGDYGTVAQIGLSKAIAGGAISAGDRLASDANGALVTQAAAAAGAANAIVVGIAQEDAAASDVFTVLLAPGVI